MLVAMVWTGLVEPTLLQTLAISSERGLNQPLGPASTYLITLGSAGGVGLACQSSGDIGVLFDYVFIDLIHVVLVGFDLDGRGLGNAVGGG